MRDSAVSRLAFRSQSGSFMLQGCPSFCSEQCSIRKIFRRLRSGPEHMTWPHEWDHPINRGVVLQDGLVVMRRDFRLMVSGFVTGSVLQAKYSPTGLPGRSGRTHVQHGTAAELSSQMLQSVDGAIAAASRDHLLSVCCIRLNSEGLVEHTGRR